MDGMASLVPAVESHSHGSVHHRSWHRVADVFATNQLNDGDVQLVSEFCAVVHHGVSPVFHPVDWFCCHDAS